MCTVAANERHSVLRAAETRNTEAVKYSQYKATERLGQAHREAHDIATRQLAALVKQQMANRTSAKELYDLMKGTEEESAAFMAYAASLKEVPPSFESILASVLPVLPVNQ